MAERALLECMLARAGCSFDVDSLRVVDVCQCGCASFELAPSDSPYRPSGYGSQVTDAYGKTSDGRDVGLILWGADGHLTYLELYSLAAQPPFDLPAPDTVSDMPPWPEPAV